MNGKGNEKFVQAHCEICGGPHRVNECPNSEKVEYLLRNDNDPKEKKFMFVKPSEPDENPRLRMDR